MSFQEQLPHFEEDKAQQLWDFLVESVMNNAGQEEKDQVTTQKEKMSLLIKFLNKQEEVQEQEQHLLKSFTFGKKLSSTGDKILSTTYRTTIQDINNKSTLNTTLVKNTTVASNGGVSAGSILSTVQPIQDFQNTINRVQLAKNLQSDTKSESIKKINKGRTNSQDSQFMQYIKRIKMNAQLSRENMQDMLATQYRIFKLTTAGKEEIDFVEWASDINRNHPIAKAYQNLKKNHFDKLRRQQQQSPDHSPQLSPQTRISNQKSINRSRNGSPLNFFNQHRAKSRDHTFTNRNHLNKEQIFNLKVESTQEDSQFRRNSATPNLSKYNFTQSTMRDSQKSPHINLSSIQENPLINNFSIRDSTQLAQVRKHLNLVKRANEYESAFLDSKHAEQFETKNPLHVYYQIVQNPDYCFKPKDVLQPALKQDVEYLREDYKQRCASEQKMARFGRSDYSYNTPQNTSYIGNKRTSIKTMYTTLSKDNTFLNDTHHTSSQNVSHHDELIQREQNYKSLQTAGSRRMSQITVGGGNLRQSQSSMRSNLPVKTVLMTINDKDNNEPEMPLTGYNYMRYLNEGRLIMNTAQSANKLNRMRTMIDRDLMKERAIQKQQKYQTLITQEQTLLAENIKPEDFEV